MSDGGGNGVVETLLPPNDNNPSPNNSASNPKSLFSKVVGTKKDRATVIPNMHEMVNNARLARIYQFKPSPPIAFRTMMYRKFPSIYSITFPKIRRGNTYFPVATCMFEDKDEWAAADCVELEIGGKKVTLKAKVKNGENDTLTDFGIFVPYRIKKMFVKDVQFEMANHKCLAKAFSGFCTFTKNNQTLCLDNNGTWNGDMVILFDQFTKVPTRYFETVQLDKYIEI